MATGDKKRALMADDLNNAGSDYPVMPLKTVDSSPDASHTNNLITSAAVAAALADKADKTGLTDIFTTGSTNNSGGAIGAGVFFYKDGTLVQAKTAIASVATLTLNTNYEVPTAGALNALKSAIDNIAAYHSGETFTTSFSRYQCVFETTSQLRIFVQLDKPIAAGVSLSGSFTQAEVYIEGTDTAYSFDNTYTMSVSTAGNRQQVVVIINGTFSNAVRYKPGIVILTGTITFS